MAYEIKIHSMKRNASGVIRQITWSASNEITATNAVQTDLNAISASDPAFIPFASVTEAKAKEWIEGQFDVAGLLEQKSKETVFDGLPWAEGVSA